MRDGLKALSMVHILRESISHAASLFKLNNYTTLKADCEIGIL